MNPSTAFARALVDELARCAVTDAVVAPGSRSGPLALALHEERRIRLHVRVDERSAAYLALGLARRSGRCVPVVCTSGTAAAALHPAIVEADAAGVGLLALTADRPPELRGTGASQTIDQVGLYGRSVRMFAEVGVPERMPGQIAYWRSVAARAVAAAVDGPVHLNVALREPLVPDEDPTWCEPTAGRAAGKPWVQVVRDGPAAGADLAALLGSAVPERGAVVVGDGAADPAAAQALAEACRWPLFAEPTSGARRGAQAVAAYPLVLAAEGFAQRPADVVVTVGRPGLSRAVLSWSQRATRHLVVDPRPDWADPGRTAQLVLPAVPSALPSPAPTSWSRAWQAASAAAEGAVGEVLAAAGTALSEPGAARVLGEAVPPGALVFSGPSRPVRDLDLCLPPRPDLTVLGNRGVNGIDGVVSPAIGAALAHQDVGGGHAYALLGDLSYLYDRNGLILGPDEPRPDLTLVIVDNDGGGIFSMLPQAGLPGFERVFGTPHGVDLHADADAVGIPMTTVHTADELVAALAPAAGLRLVRVVTDRRANADLHARLGRAVERAVAAC